jgi:hypothetical protein
MSVKEGLLFLDLMENSGNFLHKIFQLLKWCRPTYQTPRARLHCSDRSYWLVSLFGQLLLVRPTCTRFLCDGA